MRWFFLVASLCLVCLLGKTSGQKNWVLLIAGSNGYFNYRHQADVCHAYQIFHKAGIPDAQIVVMMYDDIAHSKFNPIKGNIINKPGGDNVYPGVPKDYTKHDVTGAVFLAVLQGNKTEVKRLTGRDGKVIDSGPEDYVFVNFADHGAPGLLATPSKPYIKATELNTAILNMHKNKKYAKMVFYVEACFSGSMFYKLLPSNINVYATTAANAKESSYACYFDAKRDAYLGDFYSVNWMEDSDVADLKTETLHEQFENVKRETNSSHVQQYGDLSIARLTLSKFFGKGKRLLGGLREESPRDVMHPEKVREEVLTRKLSGLPEGSLAWYDVREELRTYNKRKDLTERLFYTIARNVYSDMTEQRVHLEILQAFENIEERSCYENMVDLLTEQCPGLEPQDNYAALRLFQVLVNLCNHNLEMRVRDAILVAAGLNPLCLRM